MFKITQTHKKRITYLNLFILLLSTLFSFSQVLEVKGNNVVIANGDITPSLTDYTDFGSVSLGNKFARSFVLKNTGSSSLTFPSAATSVKITGSNPTEFSVTTSVVINPLSLTAGTYTIIDISYNPTTPGPKTATLTIDPSNGSPATYAFTIQGTGTAAVASDFAMTLLKPNSTFNAPYELIYAPDNYLWLTERVGKKINRVNPADGVVDLLLDLSTSLVYQTGGQDGLLGMVLHPNFGKLTGEDYVYISYTYNTNGKLTYSTLPLNTANNTFDDSTRRTKLVRYTYSITGIDGSLSNPVVLIQGLSGSNDHNSGKLRIGQDGKLYYTIGDQGHNQSTTSNACKSINAQVLPTQVEIDASNYSAYEGKILRMNLDGTIPTDNPVLNGVRSHVFTYGHRNPQGLIFSKNGKLYSSEHGPKSDDEINLIQSGMNYGWPNIAGFKDDKNYAYCNWSSMPSCIPANFSEYSCGTGATSITESGWSGTFTLPLATFYTLDDGYNFTGGYLSWPTVAPSSTRIYEGLNSEITGWDHSLITTTLKRGEIYRSKLSADGNSIVGESEALLYTQNRYRDIAFAPDGKTIYIITDSSGQTTGQSGSTGLALTNPGTILKFVYQPALISCIAPVPDVTTLPDITGQCSVASLTPPTATNACAGTIIGTTSTVFPITAQGTTIVTWTYNYGSTGVVTQTQNVIINKITTSVISGTASICLGSSTNLQVAITDGVSPFTVVYTDGTSNFTINSYTSSSNIAVSPTISTTYTLVSVTSAEGCLSPANSGSANITFPTTTWDGSSWDNSAPTSSTTAIISGNYNVSANINACTLTVNNNAIVTIPSGNNVTLNGALTVSSGSFTLNNNANLIQTTNVSNSGNIIVKRNSSPLLLLDYTLWSSPVSGQDLLNFSLLTIPTRFYTYNPNTNLYNTVASPSTTNFTIGQGYLIRMPNNASLITPTIYPGVFMGVPNNGIVPVTMANGGVGKRFNLVGNPYPSPINISQFVTDNSAAITGTLYFWRKTNNPSNPSYCTLTGEIFTSNNEAQVVNPNGIIQTGQGFFIEALNSATSLSFNNGQRVSNTTGQFFKTKAIERNTIWLNAINTLGAFSQMAVSYITDATQGVDTFDGKYYNDGNIALNSFLDNSDYVIQGRALPFDPSDVVPLTFSATTAGDYTLSIDHYDGLFSGSQDIILKDNTTGTETDLKAGSYTFTASAGTDNTRFILKYQKTLGIIKPIFNENSVTVSKNKGLIRIKSSAVAIDNVKVFDIQGRLLFEKSKVNANETNIECSKFSNQILILKIMSNGNIVVNKKVVN